MSLVNYAGQEGNYAPKQPGRRPVLSNTQITSVVQALADGKTIEDAAAVVSRERKSVENILRRLKKRLGVTNMTHLVAHYLRNGWID